MTVTAASAVHARGLCVDYDERPVLRDCSFAVPRGSLCGLVGRTGAGKTSLLRTVAGLTTPHRGSVTVGGERVVVGQVARAAFQERPEPSSPAQTVSEILGRAKSINADFMQPFAAAWLDEFDVPTRGACDHLSGGDRAHLSMAIALGSRTPLILLDEPLSGLDDVARRRVATRLRQVAAERRTTIVLTSDAVADLADFIDHVVLIERGRALLSGPVGAVRGAYRLLETPLGARSQLISVLRLASTGARAEGARHDGRVLVPVHRVPSPDRLPAGTRVSVPDLASVVAAVMGQVVEPPLQQAGEV